MKKEKVIIYGTGGTAKFYVQYDLNQEVFEVLAFSDGNKEKWNQELFRYKIVPPSELSGYDYDIIIVASVFFQDIKKELVEKYHIPENKIQTIYYGQIENIKSRYRNYYEKKNFVKKDGVSHKIIADSERIAIYTAITGAYDNLKSPQFIDKNCKYICYTDNPNLQSDIWEIRMLSSENSDFNRNAKKVKVLPHRYLQDYDWSIWVDGALEITGDLRKAINTYMLNSHFLSFLHYRRSSVYSEAEVVKSAGFDDAALIDRQIEKYRNDGFLDDNELIAGGALFRKHKEPDVVKTMERWWQEIAGYSRRDQLSFNYCAWKESFSFDLIDENYNENKFIKPYPHNRKKL